MAALVVLVLAGLAVGWFAWYQASRSRMSQPLAIPQRLTSNPTEHDLPFDWTLDHSAVVFISNRTGAGNTFNIFRQRIDETSAEMLVFGSEQKTISRLHPDGSQILYLVPPNPRDTGGERRAQLERDSQVCA